MCLEEKGSTDINANAVDTDNTENGEAICANQNSALGAIATNGT
jgi:hypothetical protein